MFNKIRGWLFGKKEAGKIRFFKAPGQSNPGAYHKHRFKKLKEGKLPGQ